MTLLTTPQVAERLQLSASTLEDWRWKRIGPPFLRLSRGCIRYSAEAVDAWIARHAVFESPRSPELACPR